MSGFGRRGVSRRGALRGGALAATGLFGGLLRQLDAGAAEPAGTKRLVIVTHGHGLGALRADMSAPLHAPNLPEKSALTLPPFMDSLRGFEQKMILVDGLYNLSEDTLHGSRRGAYSCRTSHRAGETDTDASDGLGDFHGPTFEHAIAKQLQTTPLYLGGATPFNDPLFASATASGTPAEQPLESDPVKAFGRIFGTGGADSDAAALKRQWAQRKRLIDHARDHVKRVNAALPAAERPKLEQLVGSLTDLESQLAARISGAMDACTADRATVLGRTPAPALTKYDVYFPSLAKQLKQQIDILTTALACAKTRVGVLQISKQTDYSVFPGIADAKHVGQEMKHTLHDLYHDYLRDDWKNYLGEFSEPQPDPDEMRLNHQRFLAQQVAYLITRLQETKDINGAPLLDNTLVLWMSDSGGAHHAGSSRVPAVLIGGGLFQTGRLLAYPRLYEGDFPKVVNGVTIYADRRGNNYTECRASADLFVSVMRAYGVDVSRFGDDKYCRGPLPNL